MKTYGSLLTTLLLMFAPAALAHPLGDRTFDRAVQVVLTPKAILVEYELGLAELTLATELLDLVEPGQAPADPVAAIRQYRDVVGPILGRGLLLTVDGIETPLTLATSLEPIREDHVRLQFQFRAETPTRASPVAVQLIDTNFTGERGYRRIALRAEQGMQLLDSTTPDLLAEIPLVPTWEMTPEQEEASSRADARFAVAAAPSTAQVQQSPPTAVAEDIAVAEPTTAASASNRHDLRDLLAREGQGIGFWVILLASAFVFGMLHALKPGHGKTLVAAYLVGEQGTVRHAMALGLVTTLTHTGSVLFVALMLGSFASKRWADQSSLSFWLTMISGLLIAGLGATLLWRRWTGREDLLHVHGAGGHEHLPDGSVRWLDSGDHPHGRSHDYSHAHGPAGVTTGSLLALGFSGGLVPCDDAVLLLLFAMGAGLLQQAVYILLAFSAGLASVLIVIGVLVVKLKGFAAGRPSAGAWLEWLQIGSAALITLIGLGVCWSAL